MVLSFRNFAVSVVFLVMTGLIGISNPVLAKQVPSNINLSGHAENDKNCAKCHFDWKSKSQIAVKAEGHRGSAWGKDDHREFSNKSNQQEQLCEECHSGVIEASHPTGFIPARSLPTEFPLNEKGEMTCTTCHDIQKNGKPALQVQKRGKQFCASCHSESFFASMPDAGNSLITSGHLSADNKSSGTLDNYSTECMTCHMDKGEVSGRKVASRKFMLSTIGGGNHAVGMDYNQFQYKIDYRPVNSLPEEIFLPEGKVSCISCHKAYTKKHGEIVSKDNLCITCHDK